MTIICFMNIYTVITLKNLRVTFHLTYSNRIRPNEVTDGQPTHKDIRVFEIVLPVRPYFPLTADVPDVQLEARRLHTFNVKPLRT